LSRHPPNNPQHTTNIFHAKSNFFLFPACFWSQIGFISILTFFWGELDFTKKNNVPPINKELLPLFDSPAVSGVGSHKLLWWWCREHPSFWEGIHCVNRCSFGSRVFDPWNHQSAAILFYFAPDFNISAPWKCSIVQRDHREIIAPRHTPDPTFTCLQTGNTLSFIQGPSYTLIPTSRGGGLPARLFARSRLKIFCNIWYLNPRPTSTINIARKKLARRRFLVICCQLQSVGGAVSRNRDTTSPLPPFSLSPWGRGVTKGSAPPPKGKGLDQGPWPQREWPPHHLLGLPILRLPVPRPPPPHPPARSYGPSCRWVGCHPGPLK